MTRRWLPLALVACGGSRTPSPGPPAPLPTDAAVADAAPVDAPEVAVDDDVHDHGAGDDHDHDTELACEDVIRDLAAYPPALAADAPERDWNLAIRAHVLGEDCELVWSVDHKQCLRTKSVEACAPTLPNEIVERLTMLNRLGEQIGAARKKPATISCKHVVEGHYGVARWQGRLDGFPAKARNQMIADSRSLMQKACTAEAWSPSTRACLSLGGADLCFFNTTIRRRWGYPADGSVRTLGIPQCDAYDAAVTKLAGCAQIPPHARDSLKRINEALKASIAAASSAERIKRGQSCQAGLDAIENILRTHGC